MKLKCNYKSIASGLIVLASFGCQDTGNKHANNSKTQTKFYNDGTIQSEKRALDSDTLDFIVKTYFPNGSIESQYYLKDDLIQGYCKNYYQNGKVSAEGYYNKGKKMGWFKYYDSTEVLNKSIEYINYRDSTLSRPNQVVEVNRNGDTIWDKSLFYRIYYIKDTIKYNTERYRVLVQLRGRYFQYANIVFCDFDEKYNLSDNKSCVYQPMNNYAIEFSPNTYKLGENFIRGYILNSEYPLEKDGLVKGKGVQVFFSDKFYVIP